MTTTSYQIVIFLVGWVLGETIPKLFRNERRTSSFIASGSPQGLIELLSDINQKAERIISVSHSVTHNAEADLWYTAVVVYTYRSKKKNPVKEVEDILKNTP